MLLSENSAVIITDGDLILYYTGFYADDAYAVIDKNGVSLFVDDRYYFAAKSSSRAKVFNLKNCDLKSYIVKNGVKRAGALYGYTSAAFYTELVNFGVGVFDASDLVFEETAVKSDAELEVIKKACEIAERALKNTLPVIKKGVTELEVAARLEYEMKVSGASSPSFQTIVAFGKNAAVPHHESDGTKLSDNKAVLIDFGAKYKGYCSDMTRTFFYGKADSEFKKAYSATLEAHNLAAENIRAGMTGVEADGIARGALKKAGFGEYFTHGLGHGVGVKIHEEPRLSKKSDKTLKNGNVFSIEPGVYLNDKFGIRIEDTVCLKDDKVNSFMTFTKDLIEL